MLTLSVVDSFIGEWGSGIDGEIEGAQAQEDEQQAGGTQAQEVGAGGNGDDATDCDNAKLKAAEPWLFVGEPAGGTTGLEPAGVAGGGDSELKRWGRLRGWSSGRYSPRYLAARFSGRQTFFVAAQTDFRGVRLLYQGGRNAQSD